RLDLSEALLYGGLHQALRKLRDAEADAQAHPEADAETDPSPDAAAHPPADAPRPGRPAGGTEHARPHAVAHAHPLANVEPNEPPLRRGPRRPVARGGPPRDPHTPAR